MSNNKNEIARLKRRIAGLEQILKIVTSHSGRAEQYQRQLFETVSNTIPVPMIISSSSGKIIFFNTNALIIFGYSERKFKSINTSELYENPEDRQILIQTLKEKDIAKISVSMKKEDGSIFPATLFSRKITFENKDCLLFVTYDLSDICREEEKRMELERQLRHTRKMEAVGNLAGGIAHDFNNLLHAISGYTQILLFKRNDESEGYKELKQIEKTADRAARLVQQLLTFSRKADTRRKPIDLNTELIQAKKILERTIPKMISIELELASDLKMINADNTQIEQIIFNTGSNAADAMPDGGKLLIKTENIYLDENYCEKNLEASSGEYVLLSIIDTGHGIDKEIMANIFDPFFTTKEVGKGTGLGMASVYGIVKNHGGYISCYSEVNRGTAFKIYFPSIKSEQEKNVTKRNAEIVKGGTETILVVDDEESVRDLAVQILQHFSYSVITADSGEKAVDIYKKEKNIIDLVILDIGMPGMGGYKCLSELLAINADARVIIASGYSMTKEVKKSLEKGALGFIAKPYQLNDLLLNVRELLDN